MLRKIDTAYGVCRAVGSPDKVVRPFAHFNSHPIAWKLHYIICRDWRAARLGRAVKIISVQ